MALKDALKKIFQKRIKISKWVDYPQWKLMGLLWGKLIKSTSVLLNQPLQKKASFEEMIKHYHLTEQDLIERQTQFERWVILWLSFFVLACLYGIYLAILGSWYSVILIFVVSAMMLSQAFQYHFWSFQMTERRLNCTLKEWYKATFKKRLS